MDGTGIYVYICVHVCDPTQKGAFRGVCELVKVTHVSSQYMCVVEKNKREENSGTGMRERKTLTRIYTYTHTRTLHIQLEIRSMYIYDCTVFIFPLDPFRYRVQLRFCRNFFFPETQMLVRFTQTHANTDRCRDIMRYTLYNNILYKVYMCSMPLADANHLPTAACLSYYFWC